MAEHKVGRPRRDESGEISLLDNVKLDGVKFVIHCRDANMKLYETIAELMQDVASGEIPEELVSPGGAARMLGVTRQAINDRIHKSKSLEAWGAEGVVLISVRSIEAARQKKDGS